MVQEEGFHSLRERNVALRRQQILDAARRLIAAEGMDGLSMRKLAAEAGLAVRTLYNLWGSRGEILRALVEQALDRMDRALDEEAPLADPLQRARAIVTVTIRHLVEDEVVSRSMVLAKYQSAEIGRSDAGLITRRASAMQTTAIRAAIDQGLLLDRLDPAQLGRQIYHGYELAHVQWAFGSIDAATFEARALYGLYVALLGIATDEVRPRIEQELERIEERLRAATPHASPHATPDATGRDERRAG